MAGRHESGYVMSNGSKTGRDAFFMVLATALAGALAQPLELTAESQSAVAVAAFAVLSFGWRTLRRFAPWIASE